MPNPATRFSIALTLTRNVGISGSLLGRSMGNEIALRLRDKYASVSWTQKLDCLRDIVAAACLCHDLGNPPFGHSGEKTISTYFSEGNGQALKEQVGNREWADLINFEGNANSFRLLTHRFKGRRNGGMAMTYSSLASIVKYPYSSLHAGEKGKFGFFSSEEEIFRRVATQLGMPETDSGKFARHPLVYVTEAADDICYQIMDLEDAHKLKIIGLQEVVELLLGFFGSTDKERMQRMMNHLDDPNEKIAYLRSNAIGAMVVDCADVFSKNEETILAGEFRGTLVDNMNPRLKDAYAKCSATAWNKIYCAPEVVDIELAGNRIITYLLDTLMDAVMNPDKNYSRVGYKFISVCNVYVRHHVRSEIVSAQTDEACDNSNVYC